MSSKTRGKKNHFSAVDLMTLKGNMSTGDGVEEVERGQLPS